MPFRAKIRQILTIRESPHRIATAFALGVFIGMSPVLGLHTVLGIAIAWVLKLNRLVTLIGVYVTNPWTIVPIYSFSTWVGARLLGVHKILPDIDWHSISLLGFLSQFRPLVLPFVLGTVLMGALSSIVGYILIYHAVKSARG